MPPKKLKKKVITLLPNDERVLNKTSYSTYVINIPDEMIA